MSEKITPMDPATLKALHGSIKKWGRIVASPRNPDRGIANCPLCKEFYVAGCTGCPIAEKTHQQVCDGSPYAEWSIHQHDDHPRHKVRHRAVGCKECLRLAKAELAFLRSLLPKEKRAATRGRTAVEK